MSFVAPAFAAASAAVTSASFVSTAATILQGVATVGSVLASAQQANAQEAAGRAAAEEALIQSRIARLDGQQEVAASEARAVEVRRDALRKIGAARVAFGASGIDISSRSLAAIEGDITDEANYGLEIERTNQRRALAQAELTAGQLDLRADNALSGSKSTATATRFGGLAQLGKGLLSIVRRG